MIRSIRVKAIATITLILGAAFIFLGVYNFKISKTAIRNEIIQSSIPLLRENIYSEIKRQFLPAINVSSVMSHDTFLINWVLRGERRVSEVLQYLENIQHEYGYFSTFFVSSQTHRYYHYSGVHKTISPENDHDIWYYTFISSGKKYDLDVDKDEAGNDKLTIFINYRVDDYDGNLIGVTGVGIKMNDFSRFLASQQERYKRRIYLVDANGIIQAHSDMQAIENKNIHTTPGIASVADELVVKQSSPLMLSYEDDGKSVLVSSKYINELDWFLIVEQNETEALESAHDNLIRTFVVGSVVLVIILLFILFVTNYFNRKLELQAMSDPLTNVSNRREFIQQLDYIVQRRQRTQTPLSLLMIDVDKFKGINDSKGHPAGDFVLKEIAQRISALKRPKDILSRLGGDEFTVIVEDHYDTVYNMAERILENIRGIPFSMKDGTDIPVTLSIGIYEAKPGDTAEKILHNVDQALYRAKNSGRNCVKD